MKLFSMCTLYSKDKRPLCACFLSKDKKVVEDMKKLCSDGLMWSCLGSGVISLFDLENEIYNKRIWNKDGTSDKEFIGECQNAKIEVFSVIFTAQGYEIGITLDENEEKIIEFGRCDKTKKFWGLQEFYHQKYPKIFKGWKNYFDDFFYNEKGKKIENFLEETACRNIHNKISHCFWTEETEKYYDAQVFLMCKNSPYWMRYLKKMIEMHIDAGVDGILFDETASPYETGILGGFCKYCMENFRNFLVKKYGKKFENFDYRKFLRKKGYGISALLNNFKNVPLGCEFLLWQQDIIRKNFKELVEHVRNYAEKKSKEILITGNFGELLPYYFPILDLVDVLNIEGVFKIPPDGRNTTLYKLGKALAKDKPVTVVPSIFNSTYFRNKAKKNSISNLEKYYISEGCANFANYQIPYSCFTIEGKGAYYPDIEELKNYQEFIFEHQEFYRGEQVYEVNLVFSYPSYFFTFNWLNYPGHHFKSFSGIERLLTDLHIPHRIIIFGDGKYLKDVPVILDDKPLILPAVEYITALQIDFLENYKGEILIVGKFAEYDEKNNKREKLEKISTLYIEDFGIKYGWEQREVIRAKFKKIIADIIKTSVIETNLPVQSTLNIYREKDFLTIHIINAQYTECKGKFIPLENINIGLSRYFVSSIKSITLFTPEEPEQKINFKEENDKIYFTLKKIQICGVVKIEKD